MNKKSTGVIIDTKKKTIKPRALPDFTYDVTWLLLREKMNDQTLSYKIIK